MLFPLQPQPRQWSGLAVSSPLTLLHPHTDWAHRYWSALLEPGDFVCDATAGNGHDTVMLAKTLAALGGGTVLACDLQSEALATTQERLRSCLAEETEYGELCQEANGDGEAEEWASREDGAELRVRWRLGSHDAVLAGVPDGAARLVVFNLGYMPGGDKRIVTRAETTLAALAQAQRAVCAGGCVSVTIYGGHPEGQREEEALLEYAATQPMAQWSVYHHRWLNQRNKRSGVPAPSLLLLQRVN